MRFSMADWDNIDARGSIDDRRGSPVRTGGAIGLGGIALFALMSYLQTGTIDVAPILNEVLKSQMAPQVQQVDPSQFEGADSYEVFASTVLGSTNEYWSSVVRGYVPPRFVLFRDGTNSACGGALSDYGPHYCPSDETIYLDETFFDELQKRFGASGDVAQAYVIAHEVGHHVQTLTGTDGQSIERELQADCYAGLWAHSIRDQGVFSPGEIKEAIDAAAAVGDDHIQEVTTGRVNPETWTHGSSEERVNAFTKGYSTGDPRVCE
jgi:predicted metalloprotease